MIHTSLFFIFFFSFEKCGSIYSFSSFQSLSCVWLFETPWTEERQALLSNTNSQSLLKLRSMELVMSSNHLILYHPFSSHLQSFPASGPFPMSWLFTSGGQVLEFQLRASVLPMKIQDSQWILISFKMDWLDLLAVQGTLETLLQHHSSKASIFQHAAFFIVQLSTHTWLLEKP